MNKLIFAIVLAITSVSFSYEKKLICQTGAHSPDMDVIFEIPDQGAETLSVKLMHLDGDTVETFVNSSFAPGELSQALETGRVSAIVSKSNLKENDREGTYFDAGLVELSFNKQTKKYDVIFSANRTVYTVTCF